MSSSASSVGLTARLAKAGLLGPKTLDDAITWDMSERFMMAGDLGKVMILKELTDDEASPVVGNDVLSVEVDVSSVEDIADCAALILEGEKSAS